jgi:hypothetical protein
LPVRKKAPQAEEGKNLKLGSIKRELMKWYFEAMYNGSVKSGKRKTSPPNTTRKCKDM